MEKITKQKLIDAGISESAIFKNHKCLKCDGILVDQKPHNLVCVDCATNYKLEGE